MKGFPGSTEGLHWWLKLGRSRSSLDLLVPESAELERENRDKPGPGTEGLTKGPVAGRGGGG